MTTTDKARVRKTPAEKAQEALDIAQRRVDRTSKRVKDAEAELREAKAEDTAAVKRRDYLAQDPDLPSPKAKAPEIQTSGIASGSQTSNPSGSAS